MEYGLPSGNLWGGAVISTAPGPLASLNGGTYNLATGSGVGLFDLFGVNTTTLDPDLPGAVIGTDEPIQHNGVLLETANATLNIENAVRIDTALLEASAPLLHLTSNTTVTSTPSFGTTGLLDLTFNAKVTSLGPVTTIDASSVLVNGSALNIGPNSALLVTGDAFSIINGGSLTATFLTTLSGTSLFQTTGGLINFGGTGGNSVTVTNGVAPDVTIGGIPFSLIGGAAAGQISVAGTAIKNPGLGAVNDGGGSLIQVVGTTATVDIQGN